jgi:hypothetical protein
MIYPVVILFVFYTIIPCNGIGIVSTANIMNNIYCYNNNNMNNILELSSSSTTLSYGKGGMLDTSIYAWSRSSSSSSSIIMSDTTTKDSTWLTKNTNENSWMSSLTPASPDQPPIIWKSSPLPSNQQHWYRGSSILRNHPPLFWIKLIQRRIPCYYWKFVMIWRRILFPLVHVYHYHVYDSQCNLSCPKKMYYQEGVFVRIKTGLLKHRFVPVQKHLVLIHFYQQLDWQRE